MPRTWKADEQFRNQVRLGKIQWKHILSRKNNRKPDSKLDRYYVAKGDYKTSHGYRLHWIRSTQKAEQDAQTRTRRLHRALEELREIEPKLNSYNLKQRKQIIARIEGILKKRHCQELIRYDVHATREYKQTY
jgi:hypothetical protein